MDTKHTPGPWMTDVVPGGSAFGRAAGRAYGVSAKNKGGYRIPVVVWRGIAKPASPEGQSNARLIAAAPDLLAACDDLMLMVCEAAQTGFFDSERFEKARAAIAKATQP